MSLMHQSQMEMSRFEHETNDRRRQIPHHSHTRAVSPNFNSLPEQLPYPYQKRIVNFNNYSGVKNNMENSYFKSRAKSAPLKKAGQDTQHNQQTNEELHHSSPGKQRVLSAPSSQPSIESDYFNSALSTDGQELYIDPQYDSLSQTELDEHLSPKHKQSHNSAESLASEPQFSDTMFWLMEMTNKNLLKERGPPPSNNSHNNNGNTDFLRFDEFGSVINSDGPVTQKLNNFMSPAPAVGVTTREANFVPNTQNYYVQPPLQDNNTQLTQPQRVTSPIQQRVQSPSQTDPQVHYSAKTVRKLQHQNLKGVTHMKFEGESTASPYLFHLVTSNPRLGNAAVAIAKLNLKPGERPPAGEKHGDKRSSGEANRLVGEKPVEKPLPKSVPPTTLGNHTSQSYAVIQSSAHKEGERTTHDVFNSTLANHIPDSAVEQFKQSRLTQSADGPHRRRGKSGLTTQTSEFSTTLAAGTQFHPQETSSSFQRSMFMSDGRPKTALDRVNAFKRQIPNSNVDLAVRAMKGQQGAWTTQTQHGGRVRQNNLMVSSADNAATGSIDQLISSLRFPNNTLPPCHIKTQQHGHNNTNNNANSNRFDNTFQSLTSGTEEPDMFATTIDFGSSVQTLHYNHTAGNTMNNTLNNTASNTHISPHKNNSNDNKDLLHSIHKDPLYNVLREECEQLKNTLYRNPEAKHTLNNTKRLLTHTATSEQLPPLAQIRNNQMLKQVENELISDSITTQEIKMMRSFMSLPPAVWVTARIVYALVSSYFECYLGLENEKSFLHSGSSAIYNKQSRGNLMSFWETVEKQQKVDKLTLSSMESLYSWPYLQALLVNPLQFIKALQLIERGVVSAEHNEYFEHFPIEKLHFLRELIQNGQGLFHESVVITTGVPVCAKLCSWAKRVIANIYSSCLERMRAIQEASAGRSASPELLQQTQRQQIQPELTVTTKSPQKPHSAGGNIAGGNRLLKSTRYPHNMTIVSLLQQTEPPPLLPLTNYDAYHYANLAHTHTNNNSHYDMSVFEYTMTVAKPIDTLQMWLLPYAADSGDTNGDTQQETYSSELLEMREFFNDKLRITSASPLHTVTLLSDLPSEDSLLQANSSVQTLTAHNYLSQHAASTADLNAPTVSYKEVVAFSNKHTAGDGRISPTSRPSSKPNSANKSTISRPTSSHFNNSLSHSLAHSVTFTNYGGVVLHPALQQLLNPSSTQPDLLVVSASNKLITAEIGSDPESIRSYLESKKLHFNFSLLLAQDKRNNIMNSSQVVNAQQISQSQLLEGRGPDTVHQYVVCVTDTVNSWNAFQLALRMAKSSDVITVVHIPVVNTEEHMSTTISSAGQSSTVVQSSREAGLAYTLTKYKQQIKRTVKRIETLTALYRSAGYNLFVDEIPDFFDEAHRHISYVFQRSAAETRCKQIQRDSATENRVESGAYYATNQAKSYLATRLLSVVETYKPDFVLLGSDSNDLAVALSVGGTQPLSSSFPYTEDVTESATSAGIISHKDVAYIDSNPHTSIAVQQPQRPTDKVQRASTQQQSNVNVGVVPTSKNITVYSSHPLDADKSVYLTDQTVLDDGDSVNFIYNDNATSLLSQTHDSGSFASLPAATTYRSSAESTTAATIAPAAATNSTVTSSSNHGVGKASPTPSADEDAYGDEYDNDSFIIADDDGTNVNSVTSGEYVVLKKRSGGGRSGDSNNSIGGNSANNQEYANDEFETDILDNDDAYDVLSPHHQGNYNRPASSRGGNSGNLNNNINNTSDANNLSYSMSMEPDDFLHSPLKFNINAVSGSNTKSVSGNFPAASADKATSVVIVDTLANTETDKQYLTDYRAYCSHKVPLVEMFLFALRAKQQQAAAAAISEDVLSGVESGLQGGLKSGLSQSAVVLVNQRASL